MAPFMMFGLSALCAWCIGKIVFTGMAPVRSGPDSDLRNRPVYRYVVILFYGFPMIFALWFGLVMLNNP